MITEGIKMAIIALHSEGLSRREIQQRMKKLFNAELNDGYLVSKWLIFCPSPILGDHVAGQEDDQVHREEKRYPIFFNQNHWKKQWF